MNVYTVVVGVWESPIMTDVKRVTDAGHGFKLLWKLKSPFCPRSLYVWYHSDMYVKFTIHSSWFWHIRCNVRV